MIFLTSGKIHKFLYTKKRVETPILKPHLFISEIKPSCFGILLTTKFVITAISCFFDVTRLNDPNVKLVETLKFDPEKAFVVIVIINILLTRSNNHFRNIWPQLLFVDFFLFFLSKKIWYLDIQDSLFCFGIGCWFWWATYGGIKIDLTYFMIFH